MPPEPITCPFSGFQFSGEIHFAPPAKDRDVYRNHWSLLSDKHQVQQAVVELVDLDWLRVETQTTQGRPKVVHRINPAARIMTT